MDNIEGVKRIGLYWVESTRFGARYRIADRAYEGGKAVTLPTGTTTGRVATIEYGQAVSKRKSQPNRKLFDPTHIRPGQCPEWFDILAFLP